MTMTLQGMRDSLSVKLNTALKALHLTTYTKPNDDHTYDTLSVCAVNIDEDDSNNVQVSVLVNKVSNGYVYRYRLDVRFKDGVYTVTDQTHHNETVGDMRSTVYGKYHVSDQLTAGRK